MDEREREIADLRDRLARLEGSSSAPKRQHLGWWIGGGIILFIIAIAALSGGSSSTDNKTSAGDNSLTAEAQAAPAPALTPAEDAKRPQPSHFYSYHENDVYGYETVLSDDDRKAGKVVPSIVEFRYRGIVQGEHTLQSKDGVTFISCADPCEYARMWTIGDRDQATRFPYNPDSVFGAAIMDATTGQLIKAGVESPGTPDNTMSPAE